MVVFVLLVGRTGGSACESLALSFFIRGVPSAGASPPQPPRPPVRSLRSLTTGLNRLVLARSSGSSALLRLRLASLASPSSALVALVTSLEWGPFCCHNAGLTRQKIVLAPLHHFGQLPKKNFQKIFFRPCKSRRAQSIRAPMVPFEAEMLASTILSSSRVPSSKPKKKL